MANVQEGNSNECSRPLGKRGPKKGALYVPPALQERIRQLSICGLSISAIARRTGKDFKTVAKIVRTMDPDRYNKECQGDLQDLIPLAIKCLEEEMRNRDNPKRGKIAVDFLKAMGTFQQSVKTNAVDIRVTFDPPLPIEGASESVPTDGRSDGNIRSIR